jgi:hypothetical protein
LLYKIYIKFITCSNINDDQQIQFWIELNNTLNKDVEDITSKGVFFLKLNHYYNEKVAKDLSFMQDKEADLRKIYGKNGVMKQLLSSLKSSPNYADLQSKFLRISQQLLMKYFINNLNLRTDPQINNLEQNKKIQLELLIYNRAVDDGIFDLQWDDAICSQIEQISKKNEFLFEPLSLGIKKTGYSPSNTDPNSQKPTEVSKTENPDTYNK